MKAVSTLARDSAVKWMKSIMIFGSWSGDWNLWVLQSCHGSKTTDTGTPTFRWDAVATETFAVVSSFDFRGRQESKD